MEVISDTKKVLHDYSVVSEMEAEMKINLDTIEVMVVDEMNDLLTPIIYLNFKIELNRHQKAII